MDKKEKMNIVVKFLKKHYHTEHFYTEDKFRLLISTILSQRTMDENTSKAAKSLFSKAKNAEDILALSKNELERLIKPSGMYRQKAERIKKVCKILIEKYGGKVPKTREELLSLPGVGYKTADIVLSYGYHIPTIAVDTHVNRISKRVGLIDEKANVEDVRKGLEKLVKKKDMFIVNLGLIQFGREFCRPIKPRCHACPMRIICDYSEKTFKQGYL